QPATLPGVQLIIAPCDVDPD
uniref:SAM-dependent methyltransferase n=1 Tax=Panagrellus redivivus TaxID=6233 RepID=A0A7E4W3X6_PANRE